MINKQQRTINCIIHDVSNEWLWITKGHNSPMQVIQPKKKDVYLFSFPFFFVLTFSFILYLLIYLTLKQIENNGIRWVFERLEYFFSCLAIFLFCFLLFLGWSPEISETPILFFVVLFLLSQDFFFWMKPLLRSFWNRDLIFEDFSRN